MGDYENLVVWRRAHELVLEVYALSSAFPKNENYALTSQVRRAAVSITANIVEGNERATNKDKRHFVDMARGSLAETDYLIYLAKDLGYIDNRDTVTDLVRQTGRLLWSYRQSLR